jgi:hypothetical protein
VTWHTPRLPKRPAGPRNAQPPPKLIQNDHGRGVEQLRPSAESGGGALAPEGWDKDGCGRLSETAILSVLGSAECVSEMTVTVGFGVGLTLNYALATGMLVRRGMRC